MPGRQESLQGADPRGGQGEVECELLGEHLLLSTGRDGGTGVLLWERGRGRKGGTSILMGEGHRGD